MAGLGYNPVRSAQVVWRKLGDGPTVPNGTTSGSTNGY